MKINTKVVFEWNPKSKQYEEIYCDSYEYDGEVAECQLFGTDPSRQRQDYDYFNPQRQIGMQSLMGPILGGQSQMTGGQMGTEEASSFYGPPTTTWAGPPPTNQDYMAKLRSFGSQGKIFGPTLSQPSRPNVGSSYRTYGGPGGPTASMLGDVNIGNIPMGGPSQYTAVGGTTVAASLVLSGHTVAVTIAS